MGLSGKEELSVKIKSSGEIFFDAFGSKQGLLPKICPNIIPRIDLLESEWGTLGCTILVHYHMGGKAMISRETIVAVDAEKKSISYKLLEENFVDEDIQAIFDAWKEFLNNVTKEIDA
ncbi:hypothetical protein LguiA_001740 [Lonicera macranthoides]